MIVVGDEDGELERNMGVDAFVAYFSRLMCYGYGRIGTCMI
jgi:hypothetical protein